MPECRNCGRLFKKTYVGSRETICVECWCKLKRRSKKIEKKK